MLKELSTFECANTNNSAYLQFLTGKKLGIVNSNCNGSICLSNFFVPVSQYTQSTIVVNPNQIKKIDTSNVHVFGKQSQNTVLADTSGFITDTYYIEFSFRDSENNLLELLTWNKGNLSEDDSMDLLYSLIDNSNIMKDKIIVSGDTTEILFTGINSGEEITIIAVLKDTADISTEDIIPTVVTIPANRYTSGAIKVLFLLINYDERIEPNNKHLQYAYLSEYETGEGNFNWHNMGKIFFVTSDDDVDVSDHNLLETLMVKNTTKYQIKITALIAS